MLRIGVVLALTSVGALAACSSAPERIGTEVKHSPSAETQAASNPDDPVFGPVAFTDGSVLFVSVAGSSSCESYPSRTEELEEGILAVTVRTNGGPDCTADLTTRTFRLNGVAVPDQVLFRFDDDEVQVDVVRE